MDALLADVAGRIVAIPMSRIARTLEITEVTPLPGAPAPIAGLVVVDTEIIPAVDLGLVTDPRSAIYRPYAVTVRTSAGIVAMLVDSVRRSVSVDTEEAAATGTDGVTEVMHDDLVVLIVDVEAVAEAALSAAWNDLTIQHARLADVEDKSIKLAEAAEIAHPYLLASVNGRTYAVELSDVVQVDRDVVPTNNAAQDGALRGRYWSHGSGIPTVCACMLLFGKPGPESVDVVLLRGNKGRYALAVDSILGIRDCVPFGSSSDRGRYWAGFVSFMDEAKGSDEPATILTPSAIAELIADDQAEHAVETEVAVTTILPNYLGLRIGAKAYLLDPQMIEGIRSSAGVIFSPSAIQGDQGRTVLAEVDQRFAAVVSLQPDSPVDTLERPFWAEFQFNGVGYLLGIDRLIGFRQVAQDSFETLVGSSTAYTVLNGEIATLLTPDEILRAAPKTHPAGVN